MHDFAFLFLSNWATFKSYKRTESFHLSLFSLEEKSCENGNENVVKYSWTIKLAMDLLVPFHAIIFYYVAQAVK